MVSIIIIIISSILHFQSLIYVRVAGIYLFQFPHIVFWGSLELEGGNLMQPQELSSLSLEKG